LGSDFSPKHIVFPHTTFSTFLPRRIFQY
jgi:hypothetical protein